MQPTLNLKTTTEFPCGKTIVMVRTMTDNEMKDEGWDRDYWTDINPTCFVLDDGTIIYPSQDAEGNGPGMFFGKSQGEHITLFLSKKEA